MMLLRRVLASPFRGLALALLADVRLSNRAAQGLLIAWAWIRGGNPEIPARPAAGGEP